VVVFCRGVPAAALVVGLSLVACNLSTSANEGDRITINEFRLDQSEPPGSIDGGAWAVAQGATLTFGISVDGPVELLVLSAGEGVLAHLPLDATTYVDDCAAGPCGTSGEGTVVYTLAAIGPGDNPSVDARSVEVRVSAPTPAPAGQNKR
jgi:hypothetical protein